jgi:SAM-dependent methyltransferase
VLSDETKYGLADAYAVKTPEDNIRLYADWAGTYDTGFVAHNGYVCHLRVAEQLAQYVSNPTGAVLDIGCGTGIGGVALRHLGFDIVDGIDISAAMLVKAAEKVTAEGEPVYRQLIQADLTKPVDIASNTYAGMVSAGTFTHGHLGPESLDELWRIAAPGAICAIGINARHYALRGFADLIAADVASRTITEPELVEIDMYTNPQAHVEPGNERAIIAVCQVN